MTEDMIEVNIFPPNMNEGAFVRVEIKEQYIMDLLQCLDRGYSLRYMAKGTFGPNEGQWVYVQLTRR